MKAYNNAKEEVRGKDSIIARLQSQLIGQHQQGEPSTLMISSSPARPPPTSPIIEFPLSPAPSSSQMIEITPQELENLKQAQALYAGKYEEKVRATISSFAETINASLLYNNVGKIMEIWNELRRDKAILTPIFDRWRPREQDLEFMCVSCDEARANPIIKSTSDVAKVLLQLATEVDNVDRRVKLLKKEYTDQVCELLPGIFANPDQLKDKQVWLKEIEVKLSERVKGIIDFDDTSFFVITIQEIEKIKSHYSFLNSEVNKLRNSWKRLTKNKDDVINFSWPIEETYNEWEVKYSTHDPEQLESAPKKI